MKIATSQIVSFILTALIFIGIGSYFLDIKPAFEMPDGSAIKEWFSSFSSENDTKSTKSNSKNRKAPNVRSEGGRVIDNYNGVNIYYNGSVSNIQGRNMTSDGYNLGLKYQCVEFVKRYYYEFYNHKMPNSYGNAKDFFNPSLGDGNMNTARGLLQYTNPSYSKPKVGDLLVFGPTPYNRFGHVAIVSKIESNRVQIAQQNPGSNNPSRQWFPLVRLDNGYHIGHEFATGWLRMP